MKIDKSVAIQMYREGKSMRDIAEHFNVSKQAVSQVLFYGERVRRDGAIFENIPYKGLYEYFAENKSMSIPKFARIVTNNFNPASTTNKFRRLLEGKGVSLCKRWIDNMIDLTGMTYEHLFELREGYAEEPEVAEE